MYFSSSFGRRKTYIVPCTYFMGLLSLIFANSIENCINNSDPTLITIIGIMLSLLNAISDIGIDGWVLTLLDKEHVGLNK